MNEVVLDASALLAVLQGEPGAESVEPVLRSAFMTTVNLAEVLAKLVDRGVPEPEAFAVVVGLGLHLVDVGRDLARASAKLREGTKRLGLSLGDRVCLALGEHLGLPVVTTDRAWAKLGLAVDIRVVR
jgi:ribonuclease VapC